MENPNRSLDPKEACAYLRDVHGIKRTPGTLAKLRCLGGGPRFRKRNKAVDYQPVHLDEYAAAITSAPVRSTSELRGAT